MGFFDFQDQSIGINAAIFAIAAVVVWIAGTRVARDADELATATGISHAAVGLVLLAGITSLPEVAVSLSSAVTDSPSLAVNNLLGSIAMQIALLAVADAVFGKAALTVVAGSSVVLLQVVMNILLLTLLAVAFMVGDVAFLGAGAWSWSLAGLYVFAIWKISHSQDRHAWVVNMTDAQRHKREERRKRREQEMADSQPGSIKSLAWKLALGGLAILVAGYVLSRTGDAIARQTGLGQSFVGAVLVAISTSLPELSSVLAAVKLKRLEMAISDIFGTNLFNVGLVFAVDVAWRGGPVINEVGKFSQFASLLGALLAAIYMGGLIERQDRTVARMGVDSAAVLVAYAAGLYFLYQMR
ncbi:sodium:calcium antiporter [Ramlibacter rhizophilus]|uniref:Sodium:calcium antiporter n=1 Tax=Ramlibacter rhizophilus TaxID=1781167 RepID=A0A4Z0BCH3_9BURK|nr:sodium:calcium antiporter [Ramlibacter rhizophilus]TFY96420.1 sodium:calcium antiporter [Ramlibacter rhizophilus]